MVEQTGASDRPQPVGWRVWLWWVLASVVGWGVGGVVLGPVFGVVEPAFGLLVASAAVGAIGGAALGALQWLVLRRQLARSGWWIAVSTIGWAIGPVIVLFGGVIGALDAVLIVLLVALLWGIGGLVGGATTGAVLVWLLRQRLVGSDGAGNEAARADAMGG